MDLFDIIGPVMIGPSSSHTAGAARIGFIAQSLLGEKCVSAQVLLHGSFAKTHVGHGTDRAIVGGLMGMEVDDPRLRNSLEIAQKEGFRVTFAPTEIRNAHPNTVLINLTGESGKTLSVRCASVGGGSIRIDELDGIPMGLSGENDTLVIKHIDTKGVIAAITGQVAKAGHNIASMRDFRRTKSGEAIMTMEVDSPPDEQTLCALGSISGVQNVTFLKRRVL